MNRFNFIAIIGATGTGKSLLASQYIASHPEARLVDSLKLYEASPAVVSSFISTENTAELTECDTLIVDEIPNVFCGRPASSCFENLSGILSYRIGQSKNTIILSQSKCLVEKILDFKEIGSSGGILLTLTKDTDIETLCTYLGIMQKIRSDCPLAFNLWRQRSDYLLEEQDQHLTIPSEDWNKLLKYDIFWQFLGQSNLKCLVMNETGENMENGSVDWPIAERFINELIQDSRLSQRLKDFLSEVLSWLDGVEHKECYLLGANFISSHQPK